MVSSVSLRWGGSGNNSNVFPYIIDSISRLLIFRFRIVSSIKYKLRAIFVSLTPLFSILVIKSRHSLACVFIISLISSIESDWLCWANSKRVSDMWEFTPCMVFKCLMGVWVKWVLLILFESMGFHYFQMIR